jgi:uncharacterized membrane protein YqjE
MSAGQAERRGLLASLSALMATTVAIAHTRLELLAVDLEQERQHWLVFALLALGGLLCVGVGLVLATILLLCVFWDSHRILVLAATSGGFLLAGIAAGGALMHCLRTRSRPFATSLSELAKDREELVARR